jgi:glycosyltransferase involved in cell wall biosynthesis
VADVFCTAVLIARNEEAVIKGCLRSVRDLVDEIVVLDTGSLDRTMECASEAGARVMKSSWRDDFASARNEAIAHARGDWILSIDADEQIVGGSCQGRRLHSVSTLSPVPQSSRYPVRRPHSRIGRALDPPTGDAVRGAYRQ